MQNKQINCFEVNEYSFHIHFIFTYLYSLRTEYERRPLRPVPSSAIPATAGEWLVNKRAASGNTSRLLAKKFHCRLCYGFRSLITASFWLQKTISFSLSLTDLDVLLDTY